MAFDCEVYPREDLTSDECKALAQAVQHWSCLEAGRVAAGCDPQGLQDLLAGELPSPAWMLHLAELDEEQRAGGGQPLSGPERRQALRRLFGAEEGLPELVVAFRIQLWARRVLRLRLHTSLDSRAILRDGSVVRECVEGGAAHDRAVAVESLRQALPEELLEDVTINGLSWSEAA
jgi:hypothetical protein